MPVVIYSNALIDDIQRIFNQDNEVHNEVRQLAELHAPELVEALRVIGATIWTPEDILEGLTSRGFHTRIWREASNVIDARKLYRDAETQLRAHYLSLYGSCIVWVCSSNSAIELDN